MAKTKTKESASKSPKSNGKKSKIAISNKDNSSLNKKYDFIKDAKLTLQKQAKSVASLPEEISHIVKKLVSIGKVQGFYNA